MLLFQNGRFHAPGVSFALPDGFYLDTDPNAPREYGFAAWLESRNLWVDIYLDEESDPLTNLHNLLSGTDAGFILYSPIQEVEISGMEGYAVDYHDSDTDYYECHLVVSKNTALTMNARCRKGTVENIKELPEILEFIHNIQKEEQEWK